jgi:Na+/phosphate symporter
VRTKPSSRADHSRQTSAGLKGILVGLLGTAVMRSSSAASAFAIRLRPA